MMSTKQITIVAALVAVIIGGIAMPDPTSAYTPLEEFFYDYPVGPRDAQYRVDEQNKASAERREMEQDLYFSLQHPVQGDERALVRTDEDEKQEASEASPTEIINALTQLITAMQEDPNTAEGRRNARLVERLTLHAGAPLDQMGYANCTGGICGGCAGGICQKPLSKTGPGTVLAMLTLLGAGVWTVKRSAKARAVSSTTF